MEAAKDMYIEIYNDLDKYAMIEIEDQYKALHKYDCPLLSTGNYNEMWITSIIKKNTHYKKYIDNACVNTIIAHSLDNIC